MAQLDLLEVLFGVVPLVETVFCYLLHCTARNDFATVEVLCLTRKYTLC